ncbi:transporter [Anaeromyxobacter diazotrophicus]|uniref:Conjugal transfer protein TrbE n=1 Tax=Anaeromyxobacter diazotrophicus TaxID=2590199 RepID=A0A7I9VJT0_9BACT|nr:transporter [Anaeromyxobacter diazotrophicus]GEJ56651.1 conjugal transfer protein TrbE [Anaeromyxobacter diazotrophicus]
MLALKLFRSHAEGFSDLLNWAALVADGVVLGKDGSLLAGFFYRGQDLESATAGERNYVAERVNAAMTRLGSGFATWHDVTRLAAAEYPRRDASHFPDPVTRLIEEEQRRRFLAAGQQFACEHALLVQYTPPSRQGRKILDLVYSGEGEGPSAADRVLELFERRLGEVEDLLSAVLALRRMGSFTVTDRHGRRHRQDELVNYLQGCLAGEPRPLNLPPGGMYLDAVMGGLDLTTGDHPKLGTKHIACVAIEGFPAESYPGILDVLDELAIPFRFSSRFIHLDQREAVRELESYGRRWKQKTRGFFAQVFRTDGVLDEDAVLMGAETERATAQANSGLVGFGYYTPVIVLMHEELGALLERARVVSREIQREGFATRIEKLNTLEAYLGSLPGHGVPNIRRPLLHTGNLSHLLPLASVWAGRESCPSPLFPRESPPLLHARSTGATPFRFHLHVGDVGHTLIFGPTGSGKSVLLATIAAQFRRYAGATIWAFDKGRSLLPLASACGGRHYDIAGDGSSVAFCPLGELTADSDAAWAEEWIASAYELRAQRRPTPQQAQEVHRAVRLMRESPHRSLTDFVTTVQDEDLRAALAHYTVDGALGHLLDSREDGLVDGSFQVCEVEELMGMGEAAVLPVLLYLFRRFERLLHRNAGAPSLLIVDEAWLVLGHPVFRAKLVEWLKVLRKANCAVVLATQSLSDATRSGLVDVLQEACPTKIFLPNEEANRAGGEGYAGPGDLYRSFGLNETQIEIVRTASKKRQYYVVSPEGRRIIELGLGPVALAFVAASDKERLARIARLRSEHGDAWPFKWLEENGVAYEHLQVE